MQSFNVGHLSQLSIFLFVNSVASSSYVFAANETLQDDNDEYMFDQALFRGQSGQQVAVLERLSQKQTVLPGAYKVDVYANGTFIQRIQLQFKERKENDVQACLDVDALKRIGIAPKTLSDLVTEQAQCHFLTDIVEGSRSELDFNRLRLNLSIPQSEMLNLPRGYVSPEQWDVGSSIGFVNYSANYYQSAYDQGETTRDQSAAYVSLNGGVNVGKWQYRQQSSINWSNDGDTQWNNIRSYVSRPVETVQGVLTMGQISSSGRLFSGLSFNGLSLSSDERMLPESVRGYAPSIQGIAKTTAKVSVIQNGREIYQTTVAPGPFKINDLYPTSFNGDLSVKVQEADGSVSQFKVPFSAVPESIRAGKSHYNFDIGKTRNIGEDTYFSNMTYQRGLSNAMTLNSGLRLADGYQAALMGGTYASSIGAFGVNATYSRADFENQGTLDGWMANLNFSKTYKPTDTTISLAGYRYSTLGYRDLGDVIGEWGAAKKGELWSSSSYRQRSRFELTLNQSLNTYGMLFLSGSLQSYRDGRDDDLQMQLGYGKTFNNGLSLNASVLRQRYSSNIYNNNSNNNSNNDGFTQNGFEFESSRNSLNNLNSRDTDTSFSLSLSFPLGGRNKARAPSLSFSYSGGGQSSDVYQSTLSGSVDKDQSLNYSLGVSRDQDMKSSTWNTNLNKRMSNATLGMNASVGQNYWQFSSNIQGALALHSAGVTLGPYLGETFALVEAKGAEGARLFNAQGTRINRQGFALVPAMTPYRFNTISLDPNGISDRVEIESNDQRIAPYAGAAVKVKFATRMGYPLLIQTKLATGDFVPLGADVLDEKGQVIGMVGQSGQLYVRAEARQGQLRVQWGDEATQQCFVAYAIDDRQVEQSIIRFEQMCMTEERQ